jgi:hypothetical protein
MVLRSQRGETFCCFLREDLLRFLVLFQYLNLCLPFLCCLCPLLCYIDLEDLISWFQSYFFANCVDDTFDCLCISVLVVFGFKFNLDVSLEFLVLPVEWWVEMLNSRVA